jgi:hypothetical protein
MLQEYQARQQGAPKEAACASSAKKSPMPKKSSKDIANKVLAKHNPSSKKK